MGMIPSKQDQHKIPEVYLKKFGYLAENQQWMVSVIKTGEKFTRQKSVGSFTAITNVFDIESDDPNIRRLFESLNSGLDTKFNCIIADIENKGELSTESDAYLIQFVANMMCRSDFWREWALGMLRHENRPHIIKAFIWHHFKDDLTFEELDNHPLFRLLNEGEPEIVINRVLMFFTGHLLLRLQHFEIVIVESQDDKPWFSSTNPVVVHNRVSKVEILEKESEIYLPLSPKYLAYIHCPLSEDKENELRQYPANKICLANDEQNTNIMKHIMDNAVGEYVIFAGEFVHRFDGDSNEKE